MTEQTSQTQSLLGSEGKIFVREWPNPRARRVVVIAHGYGEHLGRYEHVAVRLLAAGASVWGPDHLGHGRSDGERALVRDFEHLVDDLHRVVSIASATHPGLPIVLIGHSMGGMIATRYAQRFGEGLAGLVLSGPAVGRMEAIEQLLALPEIPDVPIDHAVLSRDPSVGKAYAQDPLVYHGPFKGATLAAMSSFMAAINSDKPFGQLPTLWLHGADDKLVPLENTRAGLARLRGATFVERIYAGAQHEVFNEINRDDVLDEVCAFISRVTGAS